MANFCSSIELEPRTLREGQLNQAREVAVDVLQKLEPHEAKILFVEGLRPVGSVKEMEQITKNEDDQIVDCKEKAQVIEMPCQCLCDNNINLQTPEQGKRREPLSAPF